MTTSAVETAPVITQPDIEAELRSISKEFGLLYERLRELAGKFPDSRDTELYQAQRCAKDQANAVGRLADSLRPKSNTKE